MRIIKSITRIINNAPQNFRLAKIRYGEKRAIKRKKNLYKHIKWTKEQQKEFDDFWKENYGKIINPAWHKLYQSINGVFDARYFPEFFYTTQIEPRLNPNDYCKVISDKSLLPYFFGGDGSLVYIPEIYLSCTNRVFRTNDNRLLTKEEAEFFLHDMGPCVFKPSVDSSSGKGVFVTDLHNGIDNKTNKTVSEIFEMLDDFFIVQELITNSPLIRKICPCSLNTLRIITYYVESEIHCSPLVLRMGNGEKSVDNIHAGGLCIGVSIDGTLKTKAYKLGFGDNNITYTSHPMTDVQFEGYYIGDVRKAVDAVTKLHYRIPQLGIMSWDVTFDQKDRVVLIEANCNDQSVWFPQIVNEESIFGKDTGYFCKLLSRIN